MNSNLVDIASAFDLSVNRDSRDPNPAKKCYKGKNALTLTAWSKLDEIKIRYFYRQENQTRPLSPSASPPSVRDFDLHRKHDLKCSLLFAAWNRIVPNCRLTARQQARPRSTPSSLPLRPLAVKVRMNVNPSQKPSRILCTLEAKIGLSSFWRAHKTFACPRIVDNCFLPSSMIHSIIN